MNFPFRREPDSGLIIVGIEIDEKYDLKMVLDTGAAHTTIDSNALYLLGYDLKDSTGSVEVETASGVIETQVFSNSNSFPLTVSAGATFRFKSMISRHTEFFQIATDYWGWTFWKDASFV